MQQDKGWAWIIVVSGFFIGFLCDGIRNSYGLLYLEFLEEFQESKSVTSWIGSILFGIMNFLGPVSSILINKFGCRAVTVAGGIICAIGYIASVFGTSVFHLYISLGIFGGIGFSLLVIPFNIMIIQYFVRRRALAMGIAICGSGVGSIVFSPLSKLLIDEFGWRGTLLIEAGLVLHCVPCGLVMRPLLSNSSGKKAKTMQLSKGDYDSEAARSFIDSHHDKEIVAMTESDKRACNGVICHSAIVLKNNKDETDNSAEVIDNISGNNDVNTNGSVLDTCTGEIDKKRSKQLCETDKHVTSWQEDFHKIFHISILKNPSFIIMLVSYLFEGLAYSIPFTFLPDLTVTLGYTRSDAAILLSAIAIANTTSRVPVGLLADLKCVKKLYLYICAMCLVGVSLILVAFSKDYKVLLCFCIMYGICVGSYVVLLPLVLADLFGDKLLSETKGFTCFVNGVAGLIGLPIAGALFDVSGNYTQSFVLAGSEYFIGGLILLLTTCIRVK